MKNENVTDEMIDILQDLSQYIPHKQVNKDAENESPPTVKYHNILFGGDQVTAARARSAIRMHQNSETEWEVKRFYTYSRGLACKGGIVMGKYIFTND